MYTARRRAAFLSNCHTRRAGGRAAAQLRVGGALSAAGNRVGASQPETILAVGVSHLFSQFRVGAEGLRGLGSRRVHVLPQKKQAP